MHSTRRIWCARPEKNTLNRYARGVSNRYPISFLSCIWLTHHWRSISAFPQIPLNSDLRLVDDGWYHSIQSESLCAKPNRIAWTWHDHAVWWRFIS